MILKVENYIVELEQFLLLDVFIDKLEFKNVSFSYVEGCLVLNYINLIVFKGKMIVLVGQFGFGKFILVDLVLCYYDVLEGVLLIDGKNVKDVFIYSLCFLIGNVNQEVILFNDIFYNNIIFGVENVIME